MPRLTILIRAQCACILICGLVICVSGCGGESRVSVIPVKGELTFDGKPYGPANLVLTPTSETAKQSASGSADAQGKIVFQTFSPADGLPAGEYRVSVVPSMGNSPLPAVYFDEKSPLKVKVDSQSATIKLDLVSSAGPPSQSAGVPGIPGATDPASMLKSAMPKTGGP
jgi:hypothetical protein